ncbi:MAG TPA: acyl-CoA dehydrogenase family protein [Acidimicrobiales bacterium]|nr:acyl-CoA dehydrogenase family protein [Acidimicrobiales bacterium]
MELPPEEAELVEVVRRWVDREVRPVARRLEHADEYPADLIDAMKAMGVYGLCVPAEHGGTPVSTPCFVAVTEQLARGWMSLAGAMGGHSVVATLLTRHGTPEQRQRWLPRLASGAVRATMALTEPGGGSDLQAMRSVAPFDAAAGAYVLRGSKTWITNARRAGVIAVLCRTDPDATPTHAGFSVLLVEQGAPGLTVGADLGKLGYRGVESCELAFDGVAVGPDGVLGGAPGRGWAQMMGGLEIGRLQVAARALGVGRAAFDDALAYAQARESFGVPIWEHQQVGARLADMATSLTAARQLVAHAARRYDEAAAGGRRADMEAGMAKLFASEVAMEVALGAVRIHGGHGYSTDLDVERYLRDAPLMIVGEGTNEIQRTVIARQLVARGGLPE